MFVIYITEHLVVAVQLHNLKLSLSVINLVLSPKADRWKQSVELTASQHFLCLHF